MPRRRYCGVTREDARRIVELAKAHGVIHVHPLLSCPRVTARNMDGRIRDAELFGITIKPAGRGPARIESVRRAFRKIMDWGLLPDDYPHELDDDERIVLFFDMRRHGVEAVQNALRGGHRPRTDEFRRSLGESG